MSVQVLNEEARSALRATGERVTPARVRVLSLLLGAERALSHHDIEAQLGEGNPIDRVTLYRVLEWLVERGLAHRVAGIDRVWRFSFARGTHEDHPHFQCSRCGKVVCLAAQQPDAVPLPKGFRLERMELTLKGVCPQCD